MSFDHPMWLLLLAVSLLLGWMAMRWFVTMTSLRRNSAILFRTLVLSVLAMLVAGAASIEKTHKLSVVVVVDVSDSVRLFGSQSLMNAAEDDGNEPSTNASEHQPIPSRPVSVLDRIAAALARLDRQRSHDDLLGVVVFDGKSLVIATPTPASIADRPIDVSMSQGTNIQQALEYASALIPPDAAGRLLLFSDGNETAGHVRQLTAELSNRTGKSGTPFAHTQSALRRSQLPVDVVPIRYHLTDEVVVTGIDVPAAAAAEETVAVRVVLRSTNRAQGTLHLLLGDAELNIHDDSTAHLPNEANANPPASLRTQHGRRLTLEPGEHVEVINVRLPPGRVHRFKAIWEPRTIASDTHQRETENAASPADPKQRFVGDTIQENNQATGVLVTPGQGRVLIVEENDSSNSRLLANTLEQAGLHVSTTTPDALPEDLVSFQPYDEVIFVNVAAERVSTRIQQTLLTHVTDIGAGFLMLGSSESFAPGGWRGSSLEPILPVDLQVPDKMVVPSVAVMMVLDRSGSMGRSAMGSIKTKQQIANESAAQAIATLDSKDLVGVIAFSNSPRTVVKLGPNTDPQLVADRVRSITPNGGTNIGPALRQAKEELDAVDAQIKYIILLSDGQSQDADFLPALAKDLGDAGIQITTISVGQQADMQTMSTIAQNSGGKHYAVHNPNVLPRIFIKAIRVVRTPLVREVPFVPRIASVASPVVEDLGPIPPLGGMVMTQPRIEPTITTALVSDKNEPVLAMWPVGLGHVAAFTSDANPNRWARQWADWPGYSLFWTRLVKSIARSSEPGPYQLKLQATNNTLHIQLFAADEDQQPIDYLHVPAVLYTRSGTPVNTELEQTGPGRYETQLSLDELGDRQQTDDLVVLVKPSLGATTLPPAVGSVSLTSADEFQSLASDDALLGEIASMTGGRVLSFDDVQPRTLFDRTGVPPRMSRVPIYYPLLSLLLGFFVLDVATRRIAWDRFVSREFGGSLATNAAIATQNRSRRAAKAIASLHQSHASKASTLQRDTQTPVLDESAAASVARQAQQRRAKEEQQRLEQLRQEMLNMPHSPSVKPSDTTEVSPGKDTPINPTPPTTSNLLAAKARARQRFDESDESAS